MIKSNCQQLKQSEISKILGLLQKNRPHLEIFEESIYQRLLKPYSDLVLQILNSYFLEDQELLYVIEYEFFDYSTDQIALQLFQNKKQNKQQAKIKSQNDELRDYLFKIFEYHKRIFNPVILINQVQISLEQQLYCFVFQKQVNQYFNIKINIIGSDLINESYVVYQRNNNNNLKMDWPKLFTQSEFDFEIKQEDLLNQIKKYKPIIYELHKEILKQIVQDKQQIVIFKPTIFMEDQSYFAFSVIEGPQKYQLIIESFQSKEEAQKKYEEINFFKNMLRSFQMESVIKSYILVNNQQGFYIIKELEENIYNIDDENIALHSLIVNPNENQYVQQYTDFLQEQAKIEFYLKVIQQLLNYSKHLIQMNILPENLKLTERASIIVKDLPKQKNLNRYCISSSLNVFQMNDVVQFLKENKNIEFWSQMSINLFEKVNQSISQIYQKESNEQQQEYLKQLLIDNFFHLYASGFSNQKIEYIKQIIFDSVNSIKILQMSTKVIVNWFSKQDQDCKCSSQNQMGRKDLYFTIILRYYDEILSKEIGEIINNTCIFYKNIRIMNNLTKDLPNLTKISYNIDRPQCQTIQKELIENIDFFVLRNKQQLIEFQICTPNKFISLLFNQLKQNGLSDNPNNNKNNLINPKILKTINLFYKLKYLVVCSQL
ncbi:hypothetical protein TTHERM_00361650 (macronuclear) [Tetrahymena thermophila SB210]|uniref:Uncharacterized protein n=1 Tax=Tetrahymena thermophila (strain SB210) TaxID=312017 RepID=Q22PH9_TETTS|nr:hypothetical protein TTHERM_00361650 [Tetrahymena thermophila SB210]EAR87130.1 hypothetical protein TTHERM_00361650 [Tetrahymena thermophila SB210]|eukprot:XP_001007375.1 hypothetical protein TTHERM_00361650 [Tetrahymena thermophila SB210]